jgi:hypothetical protein
MLHNSGFTSFQDKHILGTTTFGGGVVFPLTVSWTCTFFSCLATSQAMELPEHPLAVKNVAQFRLYVA